MDHAPLSLVFSLQHTPRKINKLFIDAVIQGLSEDNGGKQTASNRTL